MIIGYSTPHRVPLNTVAPVLSGTETSGQTLSVTTGTWLRAGAFTYQWYQAITSGGSIVTSGGLMVGVSIGGATSSTYLLVPADVGEFIFCEVTATNAAGSVMAQSNATGLIAASGSFSSEAQAFFTRLSSQPTSGRKTLYAACIDAIVSAGVWTKLDALYLLAAADSATALTSLISATYNATEVSAPTFTADQGYTGASGKYLNTNFNPTQASSPQFEQDSATIFVWSLTAGQVAAASMGQNTGHRLLIDQRYTDDKTYFAVNSNTNPSVSTASGAGFYLATRRASDDQKLFKDGSQIITSSDVSSINNADITILKGDDGATGATLVGAAGIGSKLTDTEITNLYNAIHAYMQAVAGVS